MEEKVEKNPSNFIRNIISEDLKQNKNAGKVHTRFPPEPNGYLHIGHAKSICLNFGTANDFNGLCNLRFDDTNPSKEDVEYVDSIQHDVRWLGFDWQDRIYYASDYFEKLYQYALDLIRDGKAYVCELDNEQMRYYRGTLTQAGQNSPYRDRSKEENLDLFKRMRQGEFANGTKVLRAKIDMASPNLNLRDPVIYRILNVDHHRTGNQWCIYPMYDYTHCISDALEGITHSLCTLEFEDHRPLYDWFLDQLNVPCHPQQIEFARLNLNYTVLSKRKLLKMVESNIVDGWDDPRMPTISGLRRRGYTPESIRDFCDRIGIAKSDNVVDISLLEFCIREDLNKKAQRAMAVLRPLKVIIDNYPEDQVEELEASNNPEDANAGSRKIPFCREIFIERDDFMEHPPKKYFRLSPGQEIRLMHAYYITCTKVEKNSAGDIIQIHCNYDPHTRGGWSQDGRKVKGTSHWVSARHAKTAELRLFNHFFTRENPEEDKETDFLAHLNDNSIEILSDCLVEPRLALAQADESFQFVRQGYFCIDQKLSHDTKLVFNRTVTLKDSWAKAQKK